MLLHAPLADIARRISSSAGTLASAGPRACLLTAGAPSMEGLAIWMSTLGVDFEILEPAGARNAGSLAGRLRRAARAAR